MNTKVATIAKRVLGVRRAVKYYQYYHSASGRFYRYYHSASGYFLPVKLNILWHFTNHDKLDGLNRYEMKVHSQNGEDGIIAAIFRKVGVTNKFCVEFGVGDGTECNSALLKKKGWSFFWMDSEGLSESIKREYITAENINQLFAKYHVPETFDFLSIDIDYNTYWVWKALKNFGPRVVVVEYNASFPPTESVAVPYDPHGVWDGTDYFGGSLLAFAKLGAEKGYSLVACDNRGVNAFFVRNDLRDSFALKRIEEVYRPPGYGKTVNGRYIGWPHSDKQFVTV